MSVSVLHYIAFDTDYSRNRTVIKGLRGNKIKAMECRANGNILKRYIALLTFFLKNKKPINYIYLGFPSHFEVPLAFILARIFGKKVFYDIFASTYETYVLDREVVKENSWRAKFFYTVDWVGLKLADYVIVDTVAHGKFYSKLYNLNPKKQIVVYLGSDSDYFYSRNVKEETDVLFYGSYQPLQGADVIIKAAAKLPKIKFKMIGEGQTRNATENLAKSLNLKNVEFVNWLPMEKLAEEINKAKITLGIFGNTQKARVVIPNKVYDAIASKKLVITEKSLASEEIFTNGQNALLSKAASFSDLTKLIQEAINNPSLRIRISQNALNLYKQRFLPKVVVKNLLKALS